MFKPFKGCLMLALIVASTSCNPNYYQTISTENFLVDGWYVFDDFKYQGPISNGLPNGEGTVEYNNGVVVTGNFVDGVLNDSDAAYTLPEVGTINGSVVNGKLVSGKIQYLSGDVYLGSLNAFKPDGKGTYIKGDKQIFEGDFSGGNITNGQVFDVATGSTIVGNFSSWKPDGEVIEYNSAGKASGRIYSAGTDQTKTQLQQRAAANVELKNQAELSKIDGQVDQLERKKNEDLSRLEEEKNRLEEKAGEIYDLCACRVLKGCLDAISSGYTSYRYKDYYEEYGLLSPYGQGTPGYLSGITVYLPIGSSSAEVIESFQNEIAIMEECLAWKKDMENYEQLNKEKIQNLVAKSGQIAKKAEAEIKAAKQRKQDAITRQQNEMTKRVAEENKKLAKELADRANAAKAKRDEYCKKYPDCCLSSAAIARLKASKSYSPCGSAQ